MESCPLDAAFVFATARATVVRVKLVCLGGKPQKRVFLNVSEDVLMSFDWQMTVVAEKLACLRGTPQKRVFRNVSEDVLLSFCMAGVALCDVRRVSGGMCAHGRCGTKIGVSMG